ncbi:MAG: phosphatidate cytidylyltransferase [Rhodocyclales bacterium]|nr:phosphatidate cytidylyltransferase [Rhodocyclales bacterium]
MLKARVVTALLLLAGFLAMLFLLPFFGWLLFSGAVAGLGAWEWGGLVKLGTFGRRVYAFASMIFCAVLGGIVFDTGTGAIRQATLLTSIFIFAGAFWLVAVPVWLKAKWPTSARIPGMLAGGIVLIPACLALMQLRVFAPLFLLAAMASVWVADISAYLCGRAFGRHKLAPAISPGKTWEGAAGAVVGVLIYGMAAAWAFGRMPNTSGAWFLFSMALVVLTAVSILGDLFESLAKRQAGVKDSGAILPGHGGALDRIDSLTSTLPLVGLAMLFWEGQVP